jgi:hypothetical protein
MTETRKSRRGARFGWGLQLTLLLTTALYGCGGVSSEPGPVVPPSQPGPAVPSSEPGDVLPFPSPPMGGSVGPSLQESVHRWRTEPSHLPEDAPNILIVMLDDAGFGHPSTFGGEIETPTLSRLAEEGISYNRFHTTAMCSPTRAALITGRNHHRVGNGMVAEFANDWDGYTGVIPKSSATIARVLSYYGYATAAFGKDHNTPIDEVANGPYDNFPTGRGFDYFYGSLQYGRTLHPSQRRMSTTTKISISPRPWRTRRSHGCGAT